MHRLIVRSGKPSGVKVGKDEGELEFSLLWYGAQKVRVARRVRSMRRCKCVKCGGSGQSWNQVHRQGGVGGSGRAQAGRQAGAGRWVVGGGSGRSGSSVVKAMVVTKPAGENWGVSRVVCPHSGKID